MKNLIEKYNVQVPRYTSYPTVPNWKLESFSKNGYLERLNSGFSEANSEGLSIYVHLPYCESLCTYCGCNTRITINHAVEIPYIEAVLEEWNLLKKYFSEQPFIKEIHLGGGTPTFFSPENLEKLISGICAGAKLDDAASFSFEAHPANTSLEHLKKLRDVGFDRLSLGVQDFNPKVQKAINRYQTTKDVDRVVLQAKELGFRSVNFDLIYGLPFQSLESIEDTVNKVLEMRPDRIAFYSYAHVPWIHPGQRAYNEKDLPNPELKLNLFVTGRDMLLKGGYKSIGFDHFALPNDSLYTAFEQGKMHRNFMGFSDLRTPYQLGLGVSSISDIGNGFAQNIKAVEPYIQKVREGEIPISKGHLHSFTDSFIRKHILNLTCKHHTSWAHSDLREKNYMQNSLDKMDDLVDDELIEIGEQELFVTQKGRLFIRQICSGFDKDYERKSVLKRYSQGV